MSRATGGYKGTPKAPAARMAANKKTAPAKAPRKKS